MESKVNRKKIRNNLLIFLTSLSVIAALYFIYKLEIHEWTCINEQNAPGCYVTGLIYEENGQTQKARHYFKRAKELGYSRETKNERDP